MLFLFFRPWWRNSASQVISIYTRYVTSDPIQCGTTGAGEDWWIWCVLVISHRRNLSAINLLLLTVFNSYYVASYKHVAFTYWTALQVWSIICLTSCMSCGLSTRIKGFIDWLIDKFNYTISASKLLLVQGYQVFLWMVIGSVRRTDVMCRKITRLSSPALHLSSFRFIRRHIQYNETTN